MIYLDYMATTPLDQRVLEKMLPWMQQTKGFANPASNHGLGYQAKSAVKKAAGQVAQLLSCVSDEIIWTSGATESNNLALLGAAEFYQRRGHHVITMATEHKAVLDVMSVLEKKGFEVSYLKPNRDGCLNLKLLEKAIRVDTILVSVMHVNNETGVIQDMSSIADIVKSHGILLHVDGAQSVGKIAVNLKDIPIDYLSFSAHKFYGPKGAGGLFVRQKPKARLKPLIYGGGHQLGLRSGTLATHQIVGLGEAAQLASQCMQKEQLDILQLRQQFHSLITSELDGVTLNGSMDDRIAGNLNLSFDGVDGEALLYGLTEKIAVSSGSACNAATVEPSYVLRALGCSDLEADRSIRFSLGRFTTLDDIKAASAHVIKTVKQLRDLVPDECGWGDDV